MSISKKNARQESSSKQNNRPSGCGIFISDRLNDQGLALDLDLALALATYELWTATREAHPYLGLGLQQGTTKETRTMLRSRSFSTPELFFLAATRVALGVGVGLLLAGRLPRRARVNAGRALATIGALTTIPLALNLIGGRAIAARVAGPEGP
jgi:hypothetical protein